MSNSRDIVNVRDYGATGDGTTDDASAIQTALNTKGHVYIPPGTYQISSPLSFVVAGQRMFGAGGSNASTLRASNSFSGSTYPQGNALLYFGQFQPGPQIADLKLTCQTPGFVAQGINAVNSPRFKIDNCRISMFTTCLNMTGNCGGADISGLEAWAGASNGLAISIDGSVDCVNFDRLRVWPFEDPQGTTFTGRIDNGTINTTGTTLTVTSPAINALNLGQAITGAGITTCTITAFGTGTGGAGTYTVSVSQNSVTTRACTATGMSFISQTGIISGRMDGLFITNSMFICLNQLNIINGNGPVASFTGTTNGTTSLIVTGITSGSVQIGATLIVGGVAQSVTVASQTSGPSGGNGTYILSGTQGTASGTMQVGFPGPTFGSVTNTDFDSFNSLIQSAGYLNVSNCMFTGANGSFGQMPTNLVTVTGGYLEVTSSFFFCGGPSVGIAVGSGATSVIITGCNFDWLSNTASAVSVSDGTVICNDNSFVRNSGVGGNYLISVVGTGVLTAMGNRAPVGRTGNFIQTTVDNWHTIVYNQTSTWTNSFAGTTTFQTISPNK